MSVQSMHFADLVEGTQEIAAHVYKAGIPSRYSFGGSQRSCWKFRPFWMFHRKDW